MKTWKIKAILTLLAAFGLMAGLSGCLTVKTTEEANLNGEWLTVEKPDGWDDQKYIFKGDELDVYQTTNGKNVHMTTWSLLIFPGGSGTGRITARCTSDYYGNPPQKGKTINMIYNRSGDTLTISFAVEAENIGSQQYKMGFKLNK